MLLGRPVRATLAGQYFWDALSERPARGTRIHAPTCMRCCALLLQDAQMCKKCTRCVCSWDGGMIGRDERGRC
eukprot:53984-Chlamydomonas_euryale.AAC.1